jgi:HPt (histidine-containing phosphotransfer) domain-containing protein
MKEHRIELDLTIIEDIADGDPNAVAELIATFQRHTNDGIRKLREALQSQPLLEAARVVHTCLGFTATLGITAMLPTLRELERAAIENQRDKMVLLLSRWEDEFEQIDRAMRLRIKRPAKT